MMRINRIRLSGFKSFVEPTDLRIERGLTGIVGPNGCGKSNLLEAIRWVMGEGSSKAMRGEAMDDVIFAGTDSRPARDFAEVALFAERDGRDAGPVALDARDSELEIVRRIERGAGSAYRANGRDVRAKDVALLFADAATGAHSPALVSQGKIAAVIAAKPAERRQMLEETAGIAGLHVRRKDAEQKLRAAEANLARLGDILAEMDTRIGQLRRQAKAAERYRRLSMDIRRAEGRLIFTRWREARDAAVAARAEADAAGAAVTKAQASVAQATIDQRVAAQALARDRTAHSVARDNIARIERDLMALESRRERLTDRLAEITDQLARLTADSTREDKLTGHAAAAIAALEQEISVLTGQLASLGEGRAEHVRSVAAAERVMHDNELRSAQARAEQAGIEAEQRVARNLASAAADRRVRADVALNRLTSERQALGEEADLEAAVAAMCEGLATAEAGVTAATVRLESLGVDRDTKLARRSVAQAQLAERRAEQAGITAELAALRHDTVAASSGSEAEALTVITVAPGYEAALAAALGGDVHAPVTPGGDHGWTGVKTLPTGPPAPDRTICLASHVTVPSALMARLNQIFVADADDGQPLATGQRLVTRDGRLRRWDGFVSSGDGAVAAERLARGNRLAVLELELPDIAAATIAAEVEEVQAVDELAAIETALTEAGRERSVQDDARRLALIGSDAAAAALGRYLRDSAALDVRIADARDEADAAATALGQAEAALAALPDDRAPADLVEQLTADGTAARQILAGARTMLSDGDALLAAARERHAVTQAELRGLLARASEAGQRHAAIAERRTALEQERTQLAGQPEALDTELAALNDRAAADVSALTSLATAEQVGEATLAAADQRLHALAEALATLREGRAGAEARAENQEGRRIEMGRIAGERFECPPPVLPEKLEFAAADVTDAVTESAHLDRLQAERERIGPVNLIAADELATLETEQATSRSEADELHRAINSLRGSVGTLNREGRQRLLAAFDQVDGHFQRLFATLFDGGRAHLSLTESDDPLDAGLEIMAQPPGKRLTTLTLLSGGEQALTAVALTFALFLTNPAPICVLDEVDAPLDDANVERFCDLLDRMVADTDTRYLIVTHNAVTMARMHRLFGVTMIEKGISRLVSVDLGVAEQLLAAE